MNFYYLQSESCNDRKRIKLIVGLGNPGSKYDRTRHNLGFEVIDLLEKKKKFSPGKGEYYFCKTSIENSNVVLLKPTTYMNLSGLAVHQYAESQGILPREILVVCDDFNIPLGKIRLRKSGSDGGHNGLASIIEWLGSNQFPRIRLGIGPIPDGEFAEDFVLKRFGNDQKESVLDMLNRACDAIKFWMKDGFQKAATLFNKNGI